MTNNYFKWIFVACFIMMAGFTEAQFKFGDKSSIGQTLTTDSETGIATFLVNFNTDKPNSSWMQDLNGISVSFSKCQTNKGLAVNVYDTDGVTSVYNGDFKCYRWNSYENPVHVASVDSLTAILAKYGEKVAGTADSVKNVIWKPSPCLFDVNGDDTNQAFGAHPGMYKKVVYGFQFSFDGVEVASDIEFDLDTYDEGNTGSTASYDMVVAVGGEEDVVATVNGFYVTGSGKQHVMVAATAGIDFASFSNKKVFIWVKTDGTGTEMSRDKFDPTVVFDNFMVKYQMPFWVMPPAGVAGNSILDNAAMPFESAMGIETTAEIHLQTKGRLGSLKITNDLLDNTEMLLTFPDTLGLFANDGSGNYNVEVPYIFTEPVFDGATWSKAKIEVPAPVAGAVNDDLVLKVKLTPLSAVAKKARLELDCGTRIWYDFYFKGTGTTIDLTEVADGFILRDTLPGVPDGALILLAPGKTYYIGGYAFDKSLEFRSSDLAAGDKPVVNCGNPGEGYGSNFDMVADTSVDYIVFRGLKFTGSFDDHYVMNISKQSSIGDVVFEGCEVFSLRGVVRIKDNPSTIENFTVNNCVMDSVKNYGLLTMDKAGGYVNNISITKSTFSRFQYFIVSRNNSNSLEIDECTFFEVPDVGRQLIRYREGDGANDIAQGLKISNSVLGHGWDMDNEGTYGVNGFEGLTNTAFNVLNVFATNDFAYSSDSIPGLPTVVYDGSSTELWVDPQNGDFSYADRSFTGIGNAGDPRWIPATLNDLMVSAGALLPAFSSDVTEYTLTLPKGTSTVLFTAKADPDFVVEGAGAVALSDGETKRVIVKVTTPGGKTEEYAIAVHVQAEKEILYVSSSNGVYADARDYDKNVYDALSEAGFSVTFAAKNAIFEWTPDGIVPFDYSPYSAIVISAGSGSSNVNDFAKRNYPIPCVTMQPDGPRVDKWGWTGTKKSDGDQMYVTKTYDEATAQMVVTDTTGHFILGNYNVGDTIQWTLGTAASPDFLNKEVKSFDLNDSIPEAIPLVTIPADGNSLTTMWAIPAGTSVRSMNGDYSVYERVTVPNNIVLMSLFNDGLLYASDEFDALLVRALEWAMGNEANATLASLVPSQGTLVPAFDPGKTEYQLNLPKGTATISFDAVANSALATVTLPGALALTDGMTEMVTIAVTSPDEENAVEYHIMVHVQNDSEILYVSSSNGAYSDAKAYDTNVYDALAEAGYSVTFAAKNAIFEWTPDGIVPFDYSPYSAIVISAGSGSSNVNDFAKRNYPIPCVTMQPDGPRVDKWGWTGTKKSDGDQMYVTKTYDEATAQMVVTDTTGHFILGNYNVGDTIQWTLGTAASPDFLNKEVKSFDLNDSIPDAIPLATIPADGNSLTTMWAIPAGTSVRSMNGDYSVYERVTLPNNIVLMSLFNDGLLYASDEFDALLVRALEWAMGHASASKLASLDVSSGELTPAFNPDKTEYQLILPKGTGSVSFSAQAESAFAKVEAPGEVALTNGMNELITVTVISGDNSDTTLYNVLVHVQGENEILYVSANSDGVYRTAKAYDTNVYDALAGAGYSVTFAKKGTLNNASFDYSHYAAMVISAGESSSNVNAYAQNSYPIPCVTMQPDGPRSDKWGWTGTKKSDGNQMYVTKTYDEATAQMVIKNNTHYITEVFNQDQVVTWTSGTAESPDFLGKEIKSYNLTDSIPGAIPLATIPADGSSLTTMWAITKGTSLRTNLSGGSSRVSTENRIVFMSLFNDGLLYATEDFGTLLVRSLEWVLGAGPSTSVADLGLESEVLVYPNPASNLVKVQFTLAGSQEVSFSLYNIAGQMIELASPLKYPGGTHELQFDISGLNNGIYMYMLKTGSEVRKGKLNILK